MTAEFDKQNVRLGKKLDEAFNHYKLYFADDLMLSGMCQSCSNYTGHKHKYETCMDRPCFKFYLGYKYLEWDTSFENFI